MPDLTRSATLMHDCAEFRCWAYGQATLILSGDVALETLPASTFSPPPVARCCFASACVDLSGSRPSRRLRLRWRLLSDHEPLDPARLVLEIEGELKRQDCSSGLRQSVPTGHRIDRGELRIPVPVWPGYPPDRHRHGAVSDDAKRQSLELQLRPLRPSSILDHDRIVTPPAMVSGSPAREPCNALRAHAGAGLTAPGSGAPFALACWSLRSRQQSSDMLHERRRPDRLLDEGDPSWKIPWASLHLP